MEKRFQIRFTSPPLVFTGWKEFLIQKLNEAFPAHLKKEEFDDVYNIFSLFHDQALKQNEKIISISPRDIIIFINQMGTSYAQWGNEVSISSIALFTLLKIQNPSINLANLLLKEQDIKNKFGERIKPFFAANWLDELAILWFNVEKDKATIFLLEEPILNAAKQGNYEKIDEYLEGRSGIVDVIENIVMGEKIKEFDSRQEFLGLIHIIYKSKAMEEFQKRGLNLEIIVKIILDSFSKDYVGFFDKKYAEWVESLVKLLKTTNLLSSFQTKIIK